MTGPIERGAAGGKDAAGAALRLLVYWHHQHAHPGQSLGKPEYSYYFVAQHMLPVLRQIGEVVQLREPEEAEPLYADAVQNGIECVLLCFAPPNKAPLGLACPTLTVFAWEFDTLPDETWDGDPRNDWRNVLAAHGGAIVLSRHTLGVVREVMGAGFRAAAMPVPVFDRFARAPRTAAPAGERAIAITGRIIDSREYEITPETFESTAPMERFCNRSWTGERIEWSFSREDEAAGYLGGFYAPEPWGAWSRIAAPWIMLPFAMRGIVRFSISAAGYAANAGRTIRVALGGCEHDLTLQANYEPQAIDFHLPEPSNRIRFSGLDTRPPPGAADPRSMGIGLRWIALERLDGREEPGQHKAQRVEQALSGVVYTSVLNPADGRKNWGDIVKAFCSAHRDHDDATLVLKMSHHSIASFLGRLQFLLHRIGTVRCRVLALHGFLDDAELSQLIEASTYYVNASRGEGLCMPLMEFMSAGVPAIAPVNTAMADYVSTANAFVVHSSPEPTVWPHDPRSMFRARYHRIDWESLEHAFAESYEVARSSPDRYCRMSTAARRTQAAYSSDAAVRESLCRFLRGGTRS